MSDQTPEQKEAAAKAAADKAAADKAAAGKQTAAKPAGNLIEIKIIGSVTHDGQVLPAGKKVKLPAADAKRLLALGPKIAVKPDVEE